MKGCRSLDYTIFTISVVFIVKVDIERMLADTIELLTAGLDSDADIIPIGYLMIHPDCMYQRLGATVDVKLATDMLSGDVGNDVRHECVYDIHSRLQKLNAVVETAIRHHLDAAVSNIIHNVWHRFINVSGERAQAVTCSQALMNRYFVSQLPSYS